MTKRPIYNDAMRALQQRFGTEALADILAKRNRREVLTEDDIAFIEAAPFFFLATADAEGFPDCSYKGGLPGFMRATGPAALSFPALDGNGMYRSLGNIMSNPAIGMLFIDFEAPRRLRVNGRAKVVFDDPAQADFPGAEAMVHVSDLAIFRNCPRYIHKKGEVSPYIDRGDGQAKVPDWKREPEFAALLPAFKRPPE
jgi:predicted pyridoxine 5'-phosphate oxidase superfamily flavin-nucleotide-binding protein